MHSCVHSWTNLWRNIATTSLNRWFKLSIIGAVCPVAQRDIEPLRSPAAASTPKGFLPKRLKPYPCRGCTLLARCWTLPDGWAATIFNGPGPARSEEHTSELQSRGHL